MDGRNRSQIVIALAAIVMVAWVLAAALARAQSVVPPELAVVDCSADVGNPPPGSLEWDLADKNNFYCGYEGWLNYYSNPAMAAASAANSANGSLLFRDFIGDPFREPTLRWAGSGRGEYKYVPSWTNSDETKNLLQQPFDAVLLSPVVTAANPGPFPGIVIPCHSCFVSAKESDQFSMAESLAEAGYLVIIPYSGGNSVQHVVDATDYFTATPSNPDYANEYNPWWDRLDHTGGLGIAGHSGAGGLTIVVGNTDPRYSAAVAFDPAFGSLDGLTLSKPTMIHTADYAGNISALLPPLPPVLNSLPTVLLPPGAILTLLPFAPNGFHNTKPDPNAVPKYTYFDHFKAAGIDTMQVAVRATTHIDWGRPSGGTFTTYGEMVAIYYALAWFDEYLKGGANNALDRLTATNTFDDSADVHSIGTGFFEPSYAKNGESVEKGNVPIKIADISIHNRLSWWFPTRYYLAGGALECADVRNGCP